ncbi:hypothetical protein BDR04DRAFT_1123702 [Suillus decipiens]|nr:hypothetical protein BDR04DRAFT_1123702 [Suillus decipiens]
MLKMHILWLFALESFIKEHLGQWKVWLVNENSGRWKVISRKAPGQDYCWVVVNGNEPKIGAAPSGVINSHFPTEDTLAAKVAEAQCHVLDQYGFIAFNIKRDPTWRMHTALSTLKDMIINIGLMECAYQGCIVDVKMIASSVMLMLIEDKVPFHYQWFPADVGPFNP